MPCAALTLNPVLDAGQRLGAQLATVNAALYAALEEAGALKQHHVAGHGLLGNRKAPSQLTHRGRAFREPPDHRAAGGVCQGGEHRAERGVLRMGNVNHLYDPSGKQSMKVAKALTIVNVTVDYIKST